MHFSVSFSLSALLLSTPALAQTDSTDTTKRFGIKSGRIVYTFFSALDEGISTVTFDNWGGNYKEETISMRDTAMWHRILVMLKLGPISIADSLFNIRISALQHSLEIQTPTQTWMIYPDLQIGTVTSNDVLERLSAIDPPSTRTVVGDEIFLGRLCQVVELQEDMRIWFWKNIRLKQHLFWLSGHRSEESAIFIDENYVIKPDEFKVPANIKIH